MNVRLCGGASVILMSVRVGAPYADQVVDRQRVAVATERDRRRTMSSDRQDPDARRRL
jgi:hypothetical protein